MMPGNMPEGNYQKRCVIVGGAEIRDYPFIRGILRKGDYMIYCDSGLRHMEELKAQPSLIVGDFDSHGNPHLGVETIVLPREKDDTDTFYAAREGMRRGFDAFLLIGVIGGRFDHSLANLSILLFLNSFGKPAVIADDYSEMEIVSDTPVYVSDRYPYFSLLAISGTAEGITVKGARYPLEEGVITCSYQYGVSNEVLPGQKAEVSVKKGKLLLIKDRQ